jgi:lipoyl(octanoyl) transferase
MASRVRLAVEVHRADGVEYERGVRWQLEAAARVLARRETGGGGEALALIQHAPVYTMGARGGRTHLLAPVDALEARGAAVVDSDRGGDITFHGPGQLVAYPVLDLHARGLRAVEYVRALEACAIETAAAFGVEAARVPGLPGVWASGGKLTAIGVRIGRGVSRHGLALNVDTDLAWFDAIVPCGIAGAGVTSLGRLLGQAPPFEEVVGAFRVAFERVFECELHEAAASTLAAEGAAA